MKASIALSSLVAISVFGLAGCMHDKDQGSAYGSNDSSMGHGYGARAGQEVDDGVLTTKVKTALAAHASFKTLILEVDSSNGVVTISGRVRSQALSDEVTRVASEVDGVRSVSNRLTVRGDD